MSQSESYEALQREWQKKRHEREIAEKEERLLEEMVNRARAAKLERSLSTQASSSFQQYRVAKPPGVRRQSTASGMMRSAQRSPLSTSMNRSLTLQPTTSPMDGMSMSTMPMIQEFGGMATGMINRLAEDEPANVLLVQRASQYPAPDVGTNPLEFISSLPEEEDEGFGSGPTDFFSYPPAESATPSLVSGGESAATPMSRGPSSVSGSFLMTQELARSESNLSPSMEQWSSHELYGITNTQQTQHDGKSICVGNDMLAGMGGSFPSAAESVPMSRSISTSSTSSMRSNSSKQGERAKEAHERHIQNSLRNNNLAPKPSGDADKAEPSSSASSKKDGRVPLAKASYQRPVKPRVLCKKCNEHPEGFRGQHELSRHDAAKHADVVTKWQVRDPRKLGITTGLEPVTPLDKCKACQSNKKYGAYYNAAAHLRRSHFRHKQRKHGKKQNIQVKIDRLRKDEPSMAELKKWMVEVKLRDVPPFEQNIDDVDEIDFDDFNCSLLAVSPDTNSSISSGSPYEMPMGLMAGDSGFDFREPPYVPARSLEYSHLAEEFSLAIGVAT